VITTAGPSVRACGDCGTNLGAGDRRRKICDGCRESRAERRRGYQRDYQRRLQAADPDKVRDRTRRSYRKNRDARIEGSRRYELENPQKVIASRRRYYRDNRPELITRATEYARRRGDGAEKSRERRRLLREAAGHHTREEFEALCEAFEFRCAYCGDAPDALTEDHVEALSIGGSDSIDNVLPACASCNASKGTESVDEFLERRRKEVLL
jgi:hypothetical protein